MKMFRLTRTYLTKDGPKSEPIEDILEVLKPTTVGFSGINTLRRGAEVCSAVWDRAAKRKFMNALTTTEAMDDHLAEVIDLPWARRPMAAALTTFAMSREDHISRLYDEVYRAAGIERTGEVRAREDKYLVGIIRRALFNVLWGEDVELVESNRPKVYQSAPPPEWFLEKVRELRGQVSEMRKDPQIMMLVNRLAAERQARTPPEERN